MKLHTNDSTLSGYYSAVADASPTGQEGWLDLYNKFSLRMYTIPAVAYDLNLPLRKPPKPVYVLATIGEVRELTRPKRFPSIPLHVRQYVGYHIMVPTTITDTRTRFEDVFGYLPSPDGRRAWSSIYGEIPTKMLANPPYILSNIHTKSAPYVIFSSVADYMKALAQVASYPLLTTNVNFACFPYGFDNLYLGFKTFFSRKVYLYNPGDAITVLGKCKYWRQIWVIDGRPIDVAKFGSQCIVELIARRVK